MKDVPTEVSRGLEFAAILQREDVRDILASKDQQKDRANAQSGRELHGIVAPCFSAFSYAA